MKKKSDLSLRIRLAERELAQFKLIMQTDEIKPNFSAVARQTGLSRHTVSRVWKKMNSNDEESSKKERKTRKSKFEPYKDEMIELLKQPKNTIKGVFKYLQRLHGEDTFNSYNSFKTYVRTHNLMEYRTAYEKANPRYETEAAKQIQFDWKENLSITLDTGEVIEFNLFASVLSYSRFHRFIYTKTKTKEDLLRCLIDLIETIGGLPYEFLTDNMSAVVSYSDDHKKHKHPEILQFEKDIDTPIQLCKERQPETKGKVESANRFAQWLEPYQGKLHSEAELIETIEYINNEINKEACETTGIPRNRLFQKEKEYLRPLPSKLVLESYIKDVKTMKVPTTLLVRYKGNGYSVPKKYIGKRVKMFPIADELYIYYNSTLIAVHSISSKPMNYRIEDYKEALLDQLPSKISDQEVTRQAEQNLKLLDNLGTLKPDLQTDQENDSEKDE